MKCSLWLGGHMLDYAFRERGRGDGGEKEGRREREGGREREKGERRRDGEKDRGREGEEENVASWPQALQRKTNMKTRTY